MIEYVKAKIKAFLAWLYNWATTISGVVFGGLAYLPDLIDMISGVNLTPILPPEHAAKIITVVAILKGLAALWRSRRASI